MKQLRIILVAMFLLVSLGAAPVVAASTDRACGPVYTVKYGDQLAGIAHRCGTTVSAIMRLNPAVTNPNRIYAGQRLTMSGNTPPPPVPGTTYVVKRGDTLGNIAARYRITLTALLKANPGITNRDSIYAGQVITLPAGPAPSNPPSFDRVNVPLIGVGTGTAGNSVGCGDSVEMVTRAVAPTTAPLTAAVSQLLSLQTDNKGYYGQSGLYDPLYSSHLSVKSVTIENGHAVISLTGALSLGGTCDDPRVKAMFDRIGRQYSTVHSVTVYVNGVPLDKLLSSKGE
jgi:LysM repeat protein